MSQSGTRKPVGHAASNRRTRPAHPQRPSAAHGGANAHTDDAIDTLSAINEIVNFQALSNDVPTSDPSNKRINYHAWVRRFGIYILGVGIITTIAFLLYGNRLTTRYVTSQNDIDVIQEGVSTDIEQELEKITGLILQDRDWNFFRINKLTNYWRLLDTPERVRVAETVWYQHFVFVLQNKLMDLQMSGGLSHTNTTASDNPLMNLASILGVSVPEGNIGRRSAEPQDLDKIVSDVASELQKYEAQQRNQGSRQINSGEPNSPSLAENVQHPQAHPQQHSQENAQAEVLANIPRERVLPKVGRAAQRSNVQPDVALPTAQSDQLLQRYVKAYERGNTQELLSLFADRKGGNDDRYIRQLKNNFEFLFGNSKKRQLALGVNNWSRQGGKILGKGHYNATITLDNDKGTQTIIAGLNLEMQQVGNQLQIIRFELRDRKVSVVTPELSLSKRRHKVNVALQPTASELQDVVTRFISAYEAGDIDTLTSLFAKNAKTNDRDGLKQIAEDYTALFSSTTDRQMFIQNMDWSYDNNHAKGSGELNALVFADNDNKLQELNGKIQIVAKKMDNKVVITHLYHILHRK